MTLYPTGAKPSKRVRVRKPIARKSRIRKARKTTAGAKARKPKAQRIGPLKDRLWKLFAKYVKDRDGNVCFTCDKGGLEGGAWHAGHLISRGRGSTCYDPDNVHSQCGHCNYHLKGNVAEYTYRFIVKYGREKFDVLLLKSRQAREWKVFEIRELIEALKRGGADYELLYESKYGVRLLAGLGLQEG